MAFNILRCGGSVMAISLLTRDEFRNGVLKRDNYKCVLCGQSAVDAHHIMERRLWPDGGYYLDNGASVCSECHILCERTIYTVEYVVRIADSFDYRDFRNSVGKYVRKNHVQTIKHWAYGQKMELNKTI